jgi:hypothetical protein
MPENKESFDRAINLTFELFEVTKRQKTGSESRTRTLDKQNPFGVCFREWKHQKRVFVSILEFDSFSVFGLRTHFASSLWFR